MFIFTDLGTYIFYNINIFYEILIFKNTYN